MDEDADAVLAVDFEHFLCLNPQNFSPFVVKIRLFGWNDSDLHKGPESSGGFMELRWSATVIFSGAPHALLGAIQLGWGDCDLPWRAIDL